MAEWKKIVVSGSDISQLANDSGYLSGSQNIASASVAARATLLSSDATASFADLASDARTADSASVAARATLLSADATASFADLASNARTSDSSSVAARATTLSAEATASQADNSTTASFAASGDGLFSGSFSGSFQGDGAGLTGLPGTLTVDGDTGTQDVDLIADDLQIIGTSNEVSTAVTKVGNDVKVTLGLPDSITVTASLATNAESASVSVRATTLSADATASFADLASDARTADSASVAARATLLSADATASFADVAGTARTADSASVAARATLLSADATASFADLAGTVHDGNITNAKIADTTIANVKLVNDSVTLGTTEIELGATATSIVGLENISAATGTFVYQIFESSSTIITSGSNVFGNDENDIQQFTGSILQTGSMTVSGSLDVAVGTISGSFRGDGSGLTGLATNLTVDGDTGTQEVNLIDDDLQFLGTSNKIETAITKVGNDVKVTFDLPDTVEVTASVATRANALAPTATASFADLASDARTATSASIATLASTLSNTATASFADSATTASQADSATSASAIIAGNLFPTTQGIEGQGLALDSNLDFIFGDFFGTGSTKKLNQTSAATTWSFQHNLNEVYPIVQAYTTAGDQLLAERVESIDANNIKLYFAVATTGVAAAMVGGMGVSASQATIADTASVALRANGLAPTVTASFADLASDARTADSASVAARATLLSVDATASFADVAGTARNADSSSVAARATLLSADATASFADRATTSSLANTAETASVALSGAGTFSGSFLGDGSGLTGLAGTLTVDGDSGTQDVDLIDDDLQIVGTAQEISTAVTKVGNDVKLTIALPDIVTIGDALTVTGNTTVGGNLIVNGSIVSASSLAIADQFIILASGSNGAIDGGIIVNQIDDDPDGKGKAFAFDSSANRWAIESNLNDTASAISPDAYMGVIQEGTFDAATAPLYGGTNGKGTIFVDSSDAYIYI